MIDDIRHLIIFAKVAEQASLSAAAEALGLSASTVSAHLSKLEANLGTALVYRNTRKLALTSEGTRLLDTAKAMLDLYEQGMLEFRQRSVSTSGSLRIALPAVLLGCRPFMGAFSDFARQYDEAQIHLACSDIREDIVGDGFDLALRIGELPDSTLKAKPVFTFARTVVASRSLLEGAGRPREPSDLAALPWIGLSMLPHVRSFTHVGGECSTIRYTPRISADSVEAAYRLACEGLGLAAPPAFRSAADLAGGAMLQLLPDWSLSPLTVHAVWPGNISASSLAYLFIKHLHDRFADRPL
ncbi:LysR family transcriptional regulator [Massilia sp. IC2-476]|uniref:LysR family transcriptional regulator n=1 Tax=Massilia sp. IC2-476 TaxID=2887199 RepID=UPI001D1230BE|nr:LysR family transcriptional regulator [Massilia sp. IC2-476]MCC2971088.1 LysR family transcriptional regulator [Massilia sp. IC2-476]